MRLPHFIIIGAQRCGTTALFQYLREHPRVAAPEMKEIHFFDYNHHHGAAWYLPHFPPLDDSGRVTGESTPYYFFHPHVPGRVRQFNPEVKLVVLLRNPVDRSWSHYHHEIQRRWEYRSFEEAIAREAESLAGETERMLANPSRFSFAHMHYTYLGRGLYVRQLKGWHGHFSREQLLVLHSESLYRHPDAVFQSVTDFLGLPRYSLPGYRKHNDGHYLPMSPRTRASLLEYFRPHNQRLYEYLGRDFGWDR